MDLSLWVNTIIGEEHDSNRSVVLSFFVSSFVILVPKDKDLFLSFFHLVAIVALNVLRVEAIEWKNWRNEELFS